MSLVNDRIARSVEENQPVNENIMDTPITDTTRLQGAISSSLVANQNVGHIRILLKAQSTSKTNGTHWPVIVDDQSTGKILGSLDIMLNGLNFSTDDDRAVADIHVTNQQVQSEVGSSGWVLSIAENKIREDQPACQKRYPTTRSPLPNHQRLARHDRPLEYTAQNPTTISPSEFDPSALLVAIMPETTFLKVYNCLAEKPVKTVDELQSRLEQLTLPESWKQSLPLRLIRKERRAGTLILQWGEGE